MIYFQILVVALLWYRMIVPQVVTFIDKLQQLQAKSVCDSCARDYYSCERAKLLFVDQNLARPGAHVPLRDTHKRNVTIIKHVYMITRIVHKI